MDARKSLWMEWKKGDNPHKNWVVRIHQWKEHEAAGSNNYFLLPLRNSFIRCHCPFTSNSNARYYSWRQQPFVVCIPQTNNNTKKHDGKNTNWIERRDNWIIECADYRILLDLGIVTCMAQILLQSEKLGIKASKKLEWKQRSNHCVGNYYGKWGKRRGNCAHCIDRRQLPWDRQKWNGRKHQWEEERKQSIWEVVAARPPTPSKPPRGETCRE